MAGWLAGQPAAGGIGINTNSAKQLDYSWGLAWLSLAKIHLTGAATNP